MRTSVVRPSWRTLCGAAVLGLCALAPSARAQASPFAALHQFDQDMFDCGTCVMPPAQGKDGNLYGLTDWGGADNWGTLYRIGADGSYTVLHDFGTDHAWSPAGQPVQMPNGDLWGVTSNASSHVRRASGALWRYTKAGKFSVMDRFVGANGSHPASLVQGPDGRLYGLTTAGGAYDKGEIFTVDDAGHVQPLYSFSAKTGAITPYMQLTVARDGTFYGVSYAWSPTQTGRTAWRYDAAGNFSIIHEFGADYVAGGLVEGPDGALYGQTWYGDQQTNCCGTVYRLAKDGSSFTVLHTFDGADGNEPNGLLNVDADGKLVGTTQYGGGTIYGTVFKLGIDGSGFTTLYHFDATGGYTTGITLAADGKGYGVAASGGANGFGNAWQLSLPDF